MSAVENVDSALSEILRNAGAGDVQALIDSLSEHEKKLLSELIGKIKSGEIDLADDEVNQLWKVDYDRRPPTIFEFINEDQWLGTVLKPTESNPGIFPEWKKVLCSDFDLDSRVHNVVITGSLGIGKSYVSVVVFLYRIVLATMLRNPQHFFGLSRGSSIIYAVLSVTRRAVTETALGDAINFMALSQYFTETLKFDPDMKYSDGRIPFPKNISLTYGSKGQHIIGRNAMGVFLDEGNWRLEAKPDEKAYALYDEIRTRISNRFQKTAGFLPAISVLASSARDESSFTERVIGDIEKSKDSNQKVYRYAVYWVKRPFLNLKPNWFKVAYGLKNMDPYILSGWYTENGERIEGAPHEEPPPGAKTELVPGDYHANFLRNCKTNLQSLCGISTGGSHRLLPSTVDLEHCVELAERSGLKNPAKIELIPVSNEDNKNIWDYLNHRDFLTRRASRIQPIRDPDQLRYAHVDLATTSMAGVSVCHLVGRSLVEGLVDQKTGATFSEYRLIVEYDMILSIVAGTSKPISIEKIQNFFFWLRDMCGYRFGKVTADQFQCLGGSTLVNTARGTIPIRNVVVGDLVWTKSKEPRRVLEVVSYPSADTVKVETEDGNWVECTPNHRLATVRGKTRRAETSEFEWTEARSISAGDEILMSEEVLMDRLQPSDITPEIAELVGLIYGDGCVNDNSVRIAAHASEHLDLVNLLERLFGGNPKPRSYRCRNAYMVCLNSRKLAKWLRSKGLAKDNLEIPALVLESSKKVKAAFVRGLMSADGSVSSTGQITLSTCSRTLADQVSVVLRTDFGIPSRIVRIFRSFAKGGQKTEGWSLQLRGSRSAFENKIGFLYSTKSEKLSSFRGMKGRNLAVRVKSVSRGSVQDVFDLTVDGDPSYTANGFVSHNSDNTLQMMEARGFEVGKLSLDRNKVVYYSWKTGVEDHRIRPYRQHQMMREAEQLLDLPDRVDHPKDGYKDTIDSAAGAYHNAILSAAESSTAPASIAGPGLFGNDDGQSIVHDKPPVEIIVKPAVRPTARFRM